ncbi:hypothetical protein V5799_025595 [Amblyomma americanum]|uniref:Uncharacterized protein n=1 Tax=Amblyomma americanum TaxID=6943 RepID=A0AAQ4E910_AMBAM
MEEIVCIEVELCFHSSIVDLEKKLVTAAEVFSEKEQRESTLLDLMKHLQGKVTHSLVIEAALPAGEVQVMAPHIYTSTDGTFVFAGSLNEVIRVSSGGLQRALIICLLIYYVKNLEYPSAFSQILFVVQKIVLPGEIIPRGLVSARLRKFLTVLNKIL